MVTVGPQPSSVCSKWPPWQCPSSAPVPPQGALSPLPGRGRPTECPASASGVRASRLQSCRFHRLDPVGPLLTGEQPSIEVVAAAFASLGPYFRLYAEYCKNYFRAIQTLQEIRAKPNHNPEP